MRQQPPTEITQLAKEHHVPQEELVAWFCRGFGVGEIVEAYRLAAETGRAVDSIFAMREAGIGWGAIRRELLPSHVGEDD